MKNDELHKVRVLFELGKIDRDTVARERQARLRSLVDLWGDETVALAGGWSVSTVRVYCATKKSVPPISLESLNQAETILKTIK